MTSGARTGAAYDPARAPRPKPPVIRLLSAANGSLTGRATLLVDALPPPPVVRLLADGLRAGRGRARAPSRRAVRPRRRGSRARDHGTHHFDDRRPSAP